MHRIRFYIALFVVALIIGGCGGTGGDDDDDITRYQVMDWNPDEQRYELVESTIETMHSRSEVRGDVAYMRGGGNIEAATGEPTTREDFEDALRIEGARTPRANYEIVDEVVKGWDYDSFLMFTLYHHLERSADYFESIGLDRDVVGKMRVYYAPELRLGFIPINLLTDNAAYAFTLDAFLIPPQMLLEDLPMAANRGIIVHEYSHAVFNRLVHEDERVPDYLYEPWDNEYANQLSAIDEGIADTFAALAIQDPNFIAPSVSEDLFDIDRDLSSEREYTHEMAGSLDAPVSGFNPYELGSVIASTIWAIRDYVGDDAELGAALLATLEDFSAVEPSFSLADFFNPLHGYLPDDAQADACDVFEQRLTAIAEELTCAQ